MTIKLSFSAFMFAATAMGSLYLATNDRIDCQPHHALELTLQDWLYGFAMTDFALFVILILTSLSLLMTKDPHDILCISALSFGSLLLWGLFKCVWWIIGVELVALNYSGCVAKNADIAIMILVDLGWTFWFICVQ